MKKNSIFGLIFIFLLAFTTMAQAIIIKTESGNYDKDKRTYNFNIEIAKYETSSSATLANYRNLDKKRFPVDLISRVLEIPGIVNLDIRKRYQIILEKGKVFKWEDIDSELREAIKLHFNTDKVSIEKLQ